MRVSFFSPNLVLVCESVIMTTIGDIGMQFADMDMENEENEKLILDEGIKE